MCVLWLPRYFRYSKVTIRVESIGTEDDRRIDGMSRYVLPSSSLVQKNLKRKEKKTRSKRGRTGG